jgi:hypothetical protein
MPRGANLESHEESGAVRVRATKNIMRRLGEMSPNEIGAWIYHANKSLKRNDPDLILELPPAPIPPEAAYEKPISSRLAQLLKKTKPVSRQDLEDMKNPLGFTDEEREADEQFWREREEERRLERERMLKEEDDDA